MSKTLISGEGRKLNLHNKPITLFTEPFLIASRNCLSLPTTPNIFLFLPEMVLKLVDWAILSSYCFPGSLLCKQKVYMLFNFCLVFFFSCESVFFKGVFQPKTKWVEEKLFFLPIRSQKNFCCLQSSPR